MARPDSWMPVYWADLWNDTRDLNAVEQCAYYNLLGSMWMEGGSLLNDNDRLQRMSRVTEKEWRTVSVTVTAYFECRSDGRLYQKRLGEEYAKAMKAYTARSEHIATVNSKRKQSPPTVTVTGTEDTTHNSQSPDGDTPKAPKGAGEHESFSAFWEAYPSRGSAADNRKTAVKAHLAAIKRGADPGELIHAAPHAAPLEKHGTPYVPMAATWLNRDGWLDVAKPVQTVVSPASIDHTDDEWCRVLEAFQRTGNWPMTGYGTQFGYAGCKIPAHLVAKFNLDGLGQPEFLTRRSA